LGVEVFLPLDIVMLSFCSHKKWFENISSEWSRNTIEAKLLFQICKDPYTMNFIFFLHVWKGAVANGEKDVNCIPTKLGLDD